MPTVSSIYPHDSWGQLGRLSINIMRLNPPAASNEQDEMKT